MPPGHEHSNGLKEGQQEEKTYRWKWTEDRADSYTTARELETDRHVHKLRCCHCSITIPHFHDMDRYAELAIAALAFVFLVIALFLIFPKFNHAQQEMWKGASELLAKHADDQWALCPDVWRADVYNNVSGVVQFSNSTFPKVANISCNYTFVGASGLQNVSMALPEEALLLLGFMSFFHQKPGLGEDASYWCYTQQEMIDFFKPEQTNSSIRALVTEPDGGCLSTNRNYTCITQAVNMIPDWDQVCTGLYRWGYNKTAINMTAEYVLKWIEDWTLKDVLSFGYTSPMDMKLHMKLMVRLHNFIDQQRYDYIVPLTGINDHSDSALHKFNDTLQALLSTSNLSEWAYVREAFLQTFKVDDQAAAMYRCLRSPNSSSVVVDPSSANKMEFQCYKGVDKSMWEKWQIVYNAYQQGIFRRTWSFLWFRMSMDYDTFFATWTGLVGALLSAIFAALAVSAYFVVAAVCSCWRLRKEAKRRDEGPKEIVGRIAPVQHST